MPNLAGLLDEEAESHLFAPPEFDPVTGEKREGDFALASLGVDHQASISSLGGTAAYNEGHGWLM